MMELFDMGKYDFYVWSSIGVFLLALFADFINIRSKHKHLKQQIQAKNRRRKA